VIGDGAYEDEMTDVALFMNALRAAVPAEPDPGLGADLVPRLAATARASTIETETQAQRIGAARRRRSLLTSVARVAVAIALIPFVLAGLAVAGVTVPSPARSAFDAVGITLPNQPAKGSGVSSSEHRSAQPAAEDTRGPGKLGTVSQGKSAAAHQRALEQRAIAKAEGEAIGHDRGKAIGLKDLTPPGLSGETGPPAHSNAGGSSKSHADSRAHPPHPTHPPLPTPVPSDTSTGQATTTQSQTVVGQ
jgi:hypothetical protein